MNRTCLFCLFCLLVSPVALANGLSGRDIAVRMDEADTSLDGIRQATMVIQRGNQRLVRRMAMRNKKFGDDERSLILAQVTNGVAARMAVLFALIGGDSDA